MSREPEYIFITFFQDIPFLTEWSVEMWTDEVIKDRGDFDSLTHCIIYMAEECTKRKKLFTSLPLCKERIFFRISE